ncbi:MAG: UDP-glucose 4-epimerase GalE, partial [Thermomicrobiales bacterium]
SHTAKALAKAGYLPVTLDNLSTGHAWAVKWGPLVRGDLADKNLIVETLRDYDIAAVIHFAASAYVGDSVVQPRHYYQNNIANSLNLLDAMLDVGVPQIVFSSSCATYGHPQSLPIREDHPQDPLSPYGDSKYFIERAMNAYRKAYGLKCVALRYFNAAGADPEGELGEVHSPETHLIPSIIEAALGYRTEIRVFGSDYDTPDGTCTRDFIHVSDLARAHVLALDYLISGNECAAFNLGTGTGHSVREVISVVEGVSDVIVPVKEEARRPGDAAALVADPTKAMQVLGWRPEFPSLERIVSDAWTWHTAQHDRKQAPRVAEVRPPAPAYAPL